MLHWTKGILWLWFDDFDVDESPKLFVDKRKGSSSICKTFWCCFWLTLEFVWVLMTLEWLLRLLSLLVIATWSTLEVGSSLNSLILLLTTWTLSFFFTSYDEPDELLVSSCSSIEGVSSSAWFSLDVEIEKLLHESLDELRFWMLWMQLIYLYHISLSAPPDADTQLTHNI